MVSMPSSSLSSTETSKVSSSAITSSTRLRLSASRSSANLASRVTLSAGTWSTSTAHSVNFSNASSFVTHLLLCRRCHRSLAPAEPEDLGTAVALCAAVMPRYLSSVPGSLLSNRPVSRSCPSRSVEPVPAPSQAHTQPSVHRQDGTGDVGSSVRSQKSHGLSYLIGSGHPTQRHLGLELPQAVLSECREHIRFDQSGGDHVDRDRAAGHLASHGPGHSDRSGLGGGVVGLTRRSDIGPHRGDHDDPPAVEPDHLGQGPLRRPERAG